MQAWSTEQCQYMAYLATPKPLREPKTLAEFAKTLNLAPSTLRSWHQKEGFWDAVRLTIKEGLREKGSVAVYDSIYNKAVEGDMQAAKLYLEAVEDHAEKKDVKVEGGLGEFIVTDSRPFIPDEETHVVSEQVATPSPEQHSEVQDDNSGETVGQN